MATKKLSIIITFNKGQNYLRDCLESISMQGLSSDDVEIILVGDDSEEGTKDLITKYGNIEFHKLVKGVAACRNLGLSKAKGKYIYIIDSDDFVMPGALKTMLEAIENEAADIVYGVKRKTWYGLGTELKEASKAEANEDSEDGNDEDDLPNDKNVTGTEDNNEENVIGAMGKSSALHIMYRNTGDKLLFNEDLTYYSDLPFTTRLFAQSGKVVVTDALYMKRSHNDAIRFPSLDQITDPKKPYEWLESYREAVSVLDEVEKGIDKADHERLERLVMCRNYLARHLCKHIIRKFLKGKRPEGFTWKLELCEKYAALMSEFPDKRFLNYRKKYRKVLRSFAQMKCKKAVRKAKLVVFRKKKRGLLGSSMQWKWAIYKRIFRRLPVKQNVVVFESFLGKSYGDSCKYIYEYMLSQNMPYKFVWFIDDKKAKIPGNPKKVKTLSLRYFYYVARYRYWINNMRQPGWYEKRPGTFFLETWHGTPLKRLVFDMEEVHSASPNYKMTFYRQSRVWDYLISDNPFSTEVFESAFLYPHDKILEIGYPRNDLLYNRNNSEEIDKIKTGLGLPKDKKIILYAPTWRDDEYYAPGQYKFTLPLDLSLLQSKLNDDYIILLRTHYFIADNMVITDEQKSFVKDVSRYHDIGELYLISDICITDYSSVFFDYANLKRPILFYVYDFEKYKDVLRGFYIDMENDLPGPLLYNSTQVLEAILNINQVEEEYKQKYKEFNSRFCCLDDGHAAERIVKKIWG